MDQPARVVVVGAGLAGLRTVESLRHSGFLGRLTLIGAEIELPYDRPPLSKQVLRGERDLVPLRAADSYDALDLDLRLGVRATALDTAARTVGLDDAGSVDYDALVLACGATPKTLPILPTLPGVQYLRTWRDCRELRDALALGPGRLVVIGAGFIGCEVAASARALGVEVTLLESAAQPLLRALGAELGAEIAQLHRDHGVVVALSAQVAGLAHNGAAAGGLAAADHVTGVRLADGGVLDSQLVVVGLGVRPDTDWLAGSGLSLDDGILTDAALRTNVPGIYAAGDVARVRRAGSTLRVEHWTSAGEQAGIVAANILGSQPPHEHDALPYFWSDQYDTKIQCIGVTTDYDDIALLRVGPRQARLGLYARDGRLTAVAGLSAARFVARLQGQVSDGVSLDEALAAVAQIAS